MPLFSSSSSSAAATAGLPGFLRPGTKTSRVEYQREIFSFLNLQERQRLQGASNPDSPHSVTHAVQESTLELNRYRDIVPYKHSQIYVGDPNSTLAPSSFINANRITTPTPLRSSLPPNWPGYIATQAPLPETHLRFWRMIFEQNVHVIVCLTAVSHDRLNRGPKAERYWPMAGKTDEYDKDLFVKNIDSVDGQEKVVYRHLEIWNPMDESSPRRSILLVHYQGWPDHGVPSNTNDLRDILYKIREWKLEQSAGQKDIKDFGPSVVHCSAGCGRTGTFCVIDTALSVLETTKYPHLAPSPSGHNPYGENAQPAISMPQEQQEQQGEVYDWNGGRDIIYESLISFRNERMLMVQTSSQYSFCYEAVRDLCQ